MTSDEDRSRDFFYRGWDGHRLPGCAMNNLLSQLKQIYQQPATAPATHSLLIGRKQTRRLLIGWTHLGKQAIGQELRPCRVDYIDNHLFVSLYRMFENLSSNMDKLYYLYYKLYYLYYLHVHSGRTQSAKTNKYHSGYDKKQRYDHNSSFASGSSCWS